MKRKHVVSAAILGVLIGIVAWQVACMDAHATDATPSATEMIAPATTSINPTTTDITLGSGLQLFLDDGTACTDPGIAFTSEDSGFSISGAAQMAMCVADTRVGEFNTNGISVIGALIEDGGTLTQISTATSSTEWALTATPGASRNTSIAEITAAGTAWSGGSCLKLNSTTDASITPLALNGRDAGPLLQFQVAGTPIMRVESDSDDGIKFEQARDKSVGDAFEFGNSGALSEMKEDNAGQGWIVAKPYWKQTGTAASYGFSYQPEIVSEGDGTSGDGNAAIHVDFPSGYAGGNTGGASAAFAWWVGTNGTRSSSMGSDGSLTTEGARFHSETAITGATYDLVTTDYYLNCDYTATAAITSLTLPTAQMVAGRTIHIIDTGGGAAGANITIDTEGAEKISGADTAVISANYGALSIKATAAGWFIF